MQEDCNIKLYLIPGLTRFPQLDPRSTHHKAAPERRQRGAEAGLREDDEGERHYGHREQQLQEPQDAEEREAVPPVLKFQTHA